VFIETHHPPNLLVSMTSFRSELRAQGTAALVGEVETAHGWEEHPNTMTLYFPETSADGFRVGLEASDAGVILTAGGMHVPLDDAESPVDQVRVALGLVRDLLSVRMRLRELRFAGMPYRWYLESEHDGAWSVEHEMGLLFWAPAALASMTIYQNRQLPPRRAV
jgi:hypothetical protein